MALNKKKSADKKPNTQKTRREKYNIFLSCFKPESQNTKILKHLIRKGKINAYEAFELYSITKINSRVYDLRKVGVKIETIPMGKTKTGSNKFEYRMVV